MADNPSGHWNNKGDNFPTADPHDAGQETKYIAPLRSLGSKRTQRSLKKKRGQNTNNVTAVDTSTKPITLSRIAHSNTPTLNVDEIDDDSLNKVNRISARAATFPTKPRSKSKPSVNIDSSLFLTMNPTRLFIASLGNPPPYSSTRHSAGHIVLKALQSYLQLPSFQKSKAYANGLTSMGADIGRSDLTLWQSPSLMNVSGVALLKAYKTFTSTAQSSPIDPLPGLIVLYDEMETTPGQLRVRRGATSAKGHNGLKSVQQSFQSAGLMDKLGNRFVKIGVGIGRPPGGSRASDDVSQYVLGQFGGSERRAVEDKAEELAGLLETEFIRLSK